MGGSLFPAELSSPWANRARTTGRAGEGCRKTTTIDRATEARVPAAAAHTIPFVLALSPFYGTPDQVHALFSWLRGDDSIKALLAVACVVDQNKEIHQDDRVSA